jgi:predicted nucleic acid-binding protein
VFVLDASAVVELILQTPVGVALRRRLFTPWNVLYAPEFLDLEVTDVLRRRAAYGDLLPERARVAFEDLLNFPLERFPHASLMRRVWELRGNISAYDAAYVALAEGLGAPLLTRDSRLSRAPGHQARIEII